MSNPILVSALGTIFAIDLGNRPSRFHDSIEAAWAEARISAGTPSATIAPDDWVDDEAARRFIHGELTRKAMSSVRPGVLVLRAVAVTDAEGSVTLILAADGEELTGVAKAAFRSQNLVSARFVGIDATGAVLPFREPNDRTAPGGDGEGRPEDRDLPATLRLSRIIVISEDAVALRDSSPALVAEHAAEALVASSVNLPLLPAPLRRVADLLDTCALERRTTASLSVEDESSPMRLASPWLKPRMRDDASTPSAAAPRPRSEGYFRGAVFDSRTLSDGRCVVLKGDRAAARLRILSEAETDVWQRADGAERGAVGGSGEHIDQMMSDGLLGAEPAWRIGDDVAWVGDESRTTAICAASFDETVLALEGSAHVVWSVVAEEQVVAQSRLIRRCADLFDIEIEQIWDEVESLLADLRARGALVHV